MSSGRVTAVFLVWCWGIAVPASAAAPTSPQDAVRAEAVLLDRIGSSLDGVLTQPGGLEAARSLLEASRGLREGSIREAALYTAAMALATAGETAAAASLATHLSQIYPGSRYGERYANLSTAPAANPCGPACGKDCKACNGTGTPTGPPALKSMVDECRYLIQARVRALQDTSGSADVRESGRNLTPPELKPALKSFADWMLLQQRRIETRIVTRLYATREGPQAVLHMHVTPEFTAQDYDWRLTIAKACVKDWAVKCQNINVTAGFRLYDENGHIVGDYNYRNGRLWLPKDGEPPREPNGPVEPPTLGPPIGAQGTTEPAPVTSPAKPAE